MALWRSFSSQNGHACRGFVMFWPILDDKKYRHRMYKFSDDNVIVIEHMFL